MNTEPNPGAVLQIGSIGDTGDSKTGPGAPVVSDPSRL